MLMISGVRGMYDLLDAFLVRMHNRREYQENVYTRR